MDSNKYTVIYDYLQECVNEDLYTEAHANELLDLAFDKYMTEDADTAIEILDHKIKDQRKKILALIVLCTAIIVIAIKATSKKEEDKSATGKIKTSIKKDILYKLTGVKKDLEKLKDQNKTLYKKAKSYHDKAKKLDAENTSLKSTLSATQNENERLKKQVEKLRRERNQANELTDSVNKYMGMKNKKEQVRKSVSRNSPDEDIKKAKEEYYEIEKKMETAKTDILKQANTLKQNNSTYSESIANAIGRCMKDMK